MVQNNFKFTNSQNPISLEEIRPISFDDPPSAAPYLTILPQPLRNPDGGFDHHSSAAPDLTLQSPRQMIGIAAAIECRSAPPAAPTVYN